MTIQYASDLHLEFKENEFFIRNNPIVPVGEILILAGDIVPFKSLKEFDWFFNDVSANFKSVYWVPGNHEYYHFDLCNKCRSIFENIRYNVYLVNDYAVTIENVRLIFATLWTSIMPRKQIAIQRRMNDFRLIRYNGDRLTADNLRLEHEISLALIEYELLQDTPDLKKVVVTHHVPTFINYPKEYLFDVLNEAFAVELKQLIQNTGPDYWIFGHHHRNVPDFLVGKTILTTNQLGYVTYDENKLFDPSKAIVI
jgi:predicted phosphodiesterase